MAQRLIDADAAISGVKNRCLGQSDVVKVEHSIISMLYMMPTIDAVPVRHGKWIYFKKYDDDHNFYQCTLCKSVVLDYDKPWYLYCPNCGARMDKE